MPFLNFRKHVVKIQVKIYFVTVLDYAAAFSMRGRCYMYLTEFKRALYDFSAAIRAE